ncbi:uncharacterized protein CcaverHIS019_0502440 [Cutaneotrichosporon cavernicola]|uniref:Phytanoyl-CoA dioxygenase n=1 Tax=Cutaneotrichosporon cavernicola TaxID=279322 RepID=A0AA48L5X7_9TREE|nr:uncharacterized protein CcaverHIS019_0502440 [Cutaneotrichosporon cavernicola]BEI92616.1 hypothetical protein CcaverHIS019_0502440 [Cutaneotrichosporon cavernicola]
MTKPQFLLDLERDGYVVVPNVIPEEECAAFREAALEWLESFPYGFKRDDRSTWADEHLPFGTTGGLYNRYAVNHEAFVWRIRTQPGILDVFNQIWGTDDLIASFDGMNTSIPINAISGRTDISQTPAWPHIDQNPRRIDRFELYQGIANMSPNGPDDGGLCVLKGSHLLHDKHFSDIGGFRPEADLGEKENSYRYPPQDFEWYKNHGAEVVKVCANEGDLILWDSRTVHWNRSPTGTQTRFVSYVCYAPRSRMSEDELETKLEVFRNREGTTHWPFMNVIPARRKVGGIPTRPDGTPDPADRQRPLHDVKETPEVMRLVGVRA